MSHALRPVDLLLTSQLPNLSDETPLPDLSPVQKYRITSQKIREVFEQERYSPPKLSLPKPQVTPPFTIDEDEISLAALGYSTPVAGGVVGAVGSRLLSGAISAPPLRSPAVPTAGPSFLGPMVAGAFLFSLATVFVATSYKDYADPLRGEILRVFEEIANEDISREQFALDVDGVYNRKIANYFNWIFERCNPTPVSYLLLSQGIAADSQEGYIQAQGHYQTSLIYNIQTPLRDLIHYVYARSLRLSNHPQAEILEHLDQIGENSPVFHLSQIERDALNRHVDEVFDDGVPALFICPITQEVMRDPVYYVQDSHRYYFERGAIEDWLRSHPNCPLTRRPLLREDLLSDQNLTNTIHLWNQTKLKRAANVSDL